MTNYEVIAELIEIREGEAWGTRPSDATVRRLDELVRKLRLIDNKDTLNPKYNSNQVIGATPDEMKRQHWEGIQKMLSFGNKKEE